MSKCKYIFSKNDDEGIENNLSLLYCNDPVKKIKVPTNIDNYLSNFISDLKGKKIEEEDQKLSKYKTLLKLYDRADILNDLA